MKKFLIIFAVLAASAFVLYISLLIYIDSRAEHETKVKSDVIIVLGGTIKSDNSCYGPICNQKGFVKKPRYNPCVIARVDHAVELYKEGFAPKILMSGGNDEGTNINEAENMKKFAIAAGVPTEDILIENKSTSTYENFAFSKEILTDAKLDSVIIVTDPYHIARAKLVASKLHYDYSLSPAVESVCWDQDKNKPFTNRDSRREAFALILYKLLNQI
ncbi:YdcF family protein [Candidatus Roizmanbacteria bacterium]|nr:MAG: YdcF family protein [Candidatus Roizmanbacteria bacterium]